MDLNDKFKQAEDNGRGIAISILTQHFDGFIIKEAPDRRFWDIDIYRADGTKVAIVEIKYRNNGRDRYPSDILTDGKYERLMNSNFVSYYISIYDDGYFRLYNVKHTPITHSYKFCNHITIADDGKVGKKCVEFDHKYNVLEGQWKNN